MARKVANEAKVAIVAKVEVVVEAEVNSVINNINLRAIFNVLIARIVAIKKLFVGPSRKMKQREPTLLKKLKDK